MRKLLSVVGTIILLGMTSCKPGVPRQYIQPSKMEDILCDYHIAQGMGQTAAGSEEQRNYKIRLYEDAVFRKYGVTRAEFDSSLQFYYKRSDWFRKIYERVSDRLNQQALTYGASQGELSLMTLSASGDTADIWTDRKAMLFMPMAPYNKYQFTMKADSSFHQGDHFLLSFNSSFIFQEGTRDGIAYLAIVYENDSVATQMHRIGSSGHIQMRMGNSSNLSIKALKGFFYLGRGMMESKSTLRLMFLNNIHLIRFHKRDGEQEDNTPVGGQRIMDSGREKIDSLRGGAQQRMGDSLLPPRKGTTPDGVDRGNNTIGKELQRPVKSLPQRAPADMRQKPVDMRQKPANMRQLPSDMRQKPAHMKQLPVDVKKK